MANTDLSRLLKSDEIRKVLRKPQNKVVRRVRRLNPLTNVRAMLRLNPYAAVLKRHAILTAEKRKLGKELALAKKRGITLPDDHPAMIAARTQERRKRAIRKCRSIKFPGKVAAAKPAEPTKKKGKAPAGKGKEKKVEKKQKKEKTEAPKKK